MNLISARHLISAGHLMEISKYARFDSQHDRGDMYEHSMSMRLFTLIMNKWGAPKIMREMATDTIRWIW